MRRHHRRHEPDEMRPFRPAKQFFLVLLFWALTTGAAYLCSYVQFQDAVDTGKAKTGSFLNGTIYRLNTANYIIGAILFFLVFLALWYFLGRRPLRHIRRSTALCNVFCVLISLAGIFGVFWACLWADMMNIHLFDGVEQGYLEAGTLFGWPLFALIFVTVAVVMECKKAKKHPEEKHAGEKHAME